VHEPLRVGVVVVAAGSGSRLGASVPKAFVRMGGKTLLQRALEPILELDQPVEIIVVASREWSTMADDICRSISPRWDYITIVEGGSDRHRSVGNGLAALRGDVDVVLVHDAARPFAPASLFAAVAAEVRRTGEGVVPGLAVTDTIKRVDAGRAVETIDRSQLAAMQTPQGFPLLKLVDAYNATSESMTDDAAVYAAAGNPVHIIDGDPLAFKITTPADLERAESIVGARPASQTMRTGVGIDVHAYDASVPLWLGGLYWPDQPGLAGHSDGDALSHAICDALLSAAGLGDIGSRFGTVDPRFIGAHGEVFISDTVALVAGAGYSIQNVAVQIVGNRPQLSSRRLELEKHLGDLVGAPVSVSATTSDGLGFTGRGEGLAAYATALLSAAGS
jgi:2-C-methyl-D-erythritol 4-phosphate cytidylyltransferase/2-C-methyl-D-erythritol 2,4-cyclodiphosphate synthase